VDQGLLANQPTTPSGREPKEKVFTLGPAPITCLLLILNYSKSTRVLLSEFEMIASINLDTKPNYSEFVFLLSYFSFVCPFTIFDLELK